MLCIIATCCVCYLESVPELQRLKKKKRQRLQLFILRMCYCSVNIDLIPAKPNRHLVLNLISHLRCTGLSINDLQVRKAPLRDHIFHVNPSSQLIKQGCDIKTIIELLYLVMIDFLYMIPIKNNSYSRT